MLGAVEYVWVVAADPMLVAMLVMDDIDGLGD